MYTYMHSTLRTGSGQMIRFRGQHSASAHLKCQPLPSYKALLRAKFICTRITRMLPQPDLKSRGFSDRKARMASPNPSCKPSSLRFWDAIAWTKSPQRSSLSSNLPLLRSTQRRLASNLFARICSRSSWASCSSTPSLTSLPSRSMVFRAGGGSSIPAMSEHPPDLLKNLPGTFPWGSRCLPFVEQFLEVLRSDRHGSSRPQTPVDVQIQVFARPRGIKHPRRPLIVAEIESWSVGWRIVNCGWFRPF